MSKENFDALVTRWNTMYDPHERVFSNVGSPDKTLYQAKVDSNGTLDLVENGTESLYDYIQSFKDSCDINLIIQRYASGDVDVLSKRQGAYIDSVGLPTSYAEMLDTVIAGREVFDSLPVEIKARFDYSFERWMSTMDNWSEFTDLMGVNSDPVSGSGEQPPVADAGHADNNQSPSPEGVIANEH
ncbi:VP3 [Gokushovirus MK-2017]|nr:VP3 [Gokushovirus MK-2017]